MEAHVCVQVQDNLKKKLQDKLGKDKVGEMFCLGYCYENHTFHYDSEILSVAFIMKLIKL